MKKIYMFLLCIIFGSLHMNIGTFFQAIEKKQYDEVARFLEDDRDFN